MRRLFAALLLAISPAPAVAQSVAAVRIASFNQQAQGSPAGARSIFSLSVTPIAGQGGGFLMLFDGQTPPPDGAVQPVVCFHVASGPSTTSMSMGSNPGNATGGFSWAYSTGANCQTKKATPINFVSIAFRP